MQPSVMQLLSESTVTSSVFARGLSTVSNPAGNNLTGYLGAFSTTTDLGLFIHDSTSNGVALMAVSESKCAFENTFDPARSPVLSWVVRKEKLPKSCFDLMKRGVP